MSVVSTICSILLALTILYIVGYAREDAREEVREKVREDLRNKIRQDIIDQLEVWYDNYPSLFCPMRWQVIEAIEKVEL